MLFTSCVGRQTPTYLPAIETATGTVQPENPPPTKIYATVIPDPVDTAIPDPTLTPEGKPELIKECVQIYDDLPEPNDYNGILAFETHGPKVKNSITFYNLNQTEFSEFPGTDYAYLTISPDRMMFAYQDFKANKLVVSTADGKKLSTISWGKDWGNLAGWLDNQRVIIVMNEIESPDLPNFAKYPRSVLVINPFDYHIQLLLPNYPHIDEASQNTSWDDYGTTIYSPDLSRVVYPCSMQLEGYEGMGYILYGIPEGKELAHLPGGSWNQLPLWSKDGSQFLVMGDSEFYLVSKDGQVSQVSQMNPGYLPPQKTTHNYYLYYYSWSPDERQVALWLVDEETEKITLAILDLHTGPVTDTCIPAGYNPLDIRTLPYPVWSPDGKSLVVAANYRPEEDEFDVVLVDLQEYKAFTIASNRNPVGWLAAP